MKKGVLASVGSVVLAFLATQHHNLHMFLMAFGISAAGMTLLTNPLVRRSMLVMSLLAAGFTVQQFWRADRPRAMRLMGAVSAVASLSLVAWSVSQFGV